jgi:uncharacterized protein YhfF
LTDLPPFELGYPRTDLRRKLVAAVLAGEKTATAGLAEPGEVADEPGTRYVLHDYDDEPVAIVEVTEARIVPASEIDLRFAGDEGEGFESVEDWHAAHERFFEQKLLPETKIAATRFRVVERL